MVHLLIAYTIKPNASDLFWIGNIAPDYESNREFKDKIHFRNNTDRWKSLEKLYLDIDLSDDFNSGWFLHLFVDACWDETQFIAYKNWFESANASDNWFLCYREEIAIVSYLLYHHLPWAKNVWQAIKNTQINDICASLKIAKFEFEGYRNRIVKKHIESVPNQNPSFFAMDKIIDFTETTVNKYRDFAKK